jgi:lactonase
MRLNGQSIRALLATVAALALIVALPASAAAKGAKTIYAKQLTQILPQGKEAVLFEGGAFGPDGRFYFANALAKPGQPKVLALDLETKKAEGIYTDKKSILVSTQFDSAGRLYVTDFQRGTVASMNPDGSGYRVDFSGKVEGRKLHLDDISFDPEGHMFLSDTSGTPQHPVGIVLRLDADGGNPIVLADGMASPNGVTFTPDYSALWVSEYIGKRELLLSLNEDRSAVTAKKVAMTAEVGNGKFDSNTIDAAGNVYQCINERGQIMVWSPAGKLLRTIRIRQDLGAPELSATNLAIKPGTRTAYVVVGGEAGGFVYTFQALAKGIPQSNGGSAELPHLDG